MLQTTAQRFGSTGKSFVSPSAAAAVIGAALIASGTTDDAETAWSPAAACLLPDVLPVAGTLLSYGGDRQLAAGGTVTHSVPTASTKGLILKTTDDSNSQPIFEVQNSIGSSLHRIQGSYAYFANLSVASGLTGSMINVGNTGYVQWGSRSITYAPAVGQFSFRNIAETAGATLDVTTDGTLAIKDRAGTTTGNLACGAITASGTVNYADGTIDARTSMNHALTLRATGAANAIRVLDGTGVTKWAVDSTGSMTIGTLGYITFPHSSRIGDPDQIITGGGTGFGIKTSGSLFVATGGNAATFIVGTTGSVTASGAIQETPIQSALDPTTANIPTGKRQGWYNTALSEFRDWVNIGGTLLKSAAYT